jgi:hypothetical protein
MQIHFENSYILITVKIKEEMKNILRNWKTTATGVAIIVLKVLSLRSKGWLLDAEDLTALTGGVGLILAKDNNRTGVVTQKTPDNDSAGKSN